MAVPTIIQSAGVPWETWRDSALAERSPVRWKDLIGHTRGASQALSLGVAEIPPRATLARHRHAIPEIYYVLSGAGSVEVDGIDYPAAAGSAIFIPGGALHAFSNTCAATITFVYVFPVDAFADLIYMFDETYSAPTADAHGSDGGR
jgi:quercetin dioxygenase-like cupin family protein